MNIALPTAVLHAINKLNASGYEAFAVGGCVRDAILGLQPNDWDITTSALPEEMLAVFAAYRTVDCGIQHGTLTVIIEDTPLEITTYRIDGKYSDGRHPDSVIFTRSLTEDLRRRDFTINAMAYHPTYGLCDPFDGQTDLRNKIIRCVGVPEQRFTEDALRLLRALRFASVLGFSIEPGTAAALRDLSENLACVSVERIASEWLRLICGQSTSTIIADYLKTINIFLPELAAITDLHTLPHIRPIPYARLTGLFLTAGICAEKAEIAIRRLRLDNDLLRKVTLLLSIQPTESTVPTTHADWLHILHRLGPELTLDYLLIYQMPDKSYEIVHHLLDTKACYRIDMLCVNGEDLLALGISPGPLIGDILRGLLDAVIEGACLNNRDDLLSYIPILLNEKPVQ